MPRTTSLPGSDELLAPLLVRSEKRMPDASTPAACDASGNLALDAPEPLPKRSKIDAEVQTEPLPTVVDASAQAPPLAPEQAMAMQGFSGADFAMTRYSSAKAWYDTGKCQADLLRYLFHRGSAIPARPLFDRDDQKPVLRLAPKKSRRFGERETYWEFPQRARGAALNSRRGPRCREPFLFYAF